ncbi:MAG: hypothetical protein AB4062_10115 [Crocosphaera sp.]
MNQRISHFFRVLVIFIGIIILLGWLWNIEVLKQGLIGNISTIKANTALCFFLAGIALRLLQAHPLTGLGYSIALQYQCQALQTYAAKIENQLDDFDLDNLPQTIEDFLQLYRI